MADETDLVISGEGIAPYSARGLTQTLDPIGASGYIRRTVNGELVDLSSTELRKYSSSISCSDNEAPALDGIWPGMIVTVDCVVELAYKTSGGSAARSVATGSPRVVGDYTYYRPRLTMMVVSHHQEKDEYGHVTGWNLDLEEV